MPAIIYVGDTERGGFLKIGKPREQAVSKIWRNRTPGLKGNKGRLPRFIFP